MALFMKGNCLMDIHPEKEPLHIRAVQGIQATGKKGHITGRPNAHVETYEAYCRRGEDAFKTYVEPLRGMHIDYAMLPLDPRNGNYGEKTVEYYLETADIAYFTPMHLWGNYDYIGEFAKRHPDLCRKMIAVNTQNVKMRGSIEQGVPYTVSFS